MTNCATTGARGRSSVRYVLPWGAEEEGIDTVGDVRPLGVTGPQVQVGVRKEEDGSLDERSTRCGEPHGFRGTGKEESEGG